MIVPYTVRLCCGVHPGPRSFLWDLISPKTRHSFDPQGSSQSVAIWEAKRVLSSDGTLQGWQHCRKTRFNKTQPLENNIKYIQKLSAGHTRTAVMGDDNPFFSIYSKPTMIYCNPPRIPKTSRPVTSLSQQCPHPLKCSSLRVMEASWQC